MIEILYAILMTLAAVESPGIIAKDDAKAAQYRDGVRIMASTYVEVGKAGALVSPRADAALLAAIGYEESRHRPKIKDGDCDFAAVQTCHSVGPMQISKGIRRWPEFERWSTVTDAQLREPMTAVTVAYDMLRHYKNKCGRGPDVWLSAYAMGRCPKQAIRLGRRRAALAWAIATAANSDDLPRVVAPDAKTRRKVAALTTDEVSE